MNCFICGGPLKTPASIVKGAGPVCLKKYALQMDNDLFKTDAVDIAFDAAAGDIICRRDALGTKHFNFKQHEALHSPSGMEWGYGGSGPSDFAFNALLLFVDRERALTLHQDFKREFVVRLPEAGGTISGASIREWISSKN